MTARGARKRTIWRRALAIAAAYLLVLQAALAGGAIQRMEAHAGLGAEIICLNGQEPGPAQDGSRHAPFDCCGLGCLVGAQTLQSPSSPDAGLTYPAERRFASRPDRASARAPARAERWSRPRGPPAAA